MSGKRIPEWLEEGAVLKTQGLSARRVARELKHAGYAVSYDTVWQWLWPAGNSKRIARDDPEFKQRRREYTRQWRSQRKRNVDQD